MACFPVIQMTEGEWRSVKYWDVLGVKIGTFFTDDPDLLADYISNFETRPDDVFVVSYPKSGSCCLSLFQTKQIGHLTQYITSVTSVSFCAKLLQKLGALSIQPKSPEISVGSSNGTDHFGLVRPEYSGPALKVAHSDRSGHFGRWDRNISFHLPKLLSSVPLFSILLTRTSSFQWKVKCCE